MSCSGKKAGLGSVEQLVGPGWKELCDSGPPPPSPAQAREAASPRHGHPQGSNTGCGDLPGIRHNAAHPSLWGEGPRLTAGGRALPPTPEADLALPLATLSPSVPGFLVWHTPPFFAELETTRLLQHLDSDRPALLPATLRAPSGPRALSVPPTGWGKEAESPWMNLPTLGSQGHPTHSSKAKSGGAVHYSQ